MRIKYRAGQFLHLSLDSYDPQEGYWPESRVFSIASAPGTDTVRIVYSVKGKYTTRMSRELAVGRPVSVKYPFGDFIVGTETEGETAVLVAGGTGITPFVPLLGDQNANLGSVCLYYGIRRPELMIFEEELYGASSQRGLNVQVCVEEVEEIEGQRDQRFALKEGRLDIAEIQGRHGCGPSIHYYLSGPPAMIDSFRSYLSANGVVPRNIHVDAWE